MNTSATSSSSASSTTGSQTTSSKKSLNANDFIQMMITQLQNQDPMSPTSSQDLLNQMSQIGQLQASTTLQTSLQSMVQQNQVGAAANMIGKTVKGMDDNNNTVQGTVSSVLVQDGNAYLQLDTGSSLQLGRVTNVYPAAATTTTAASNSSSSSTTSSTST